MTEPLGILPLLALPWIGRKASELAKELVATGPPSVEKFPPEAQRQFCRVEPTFTQLNAMLQGHLIKQGAQIPQQSIGRWDAKSCAAWWKYQKEPITPLSVMRIMGPFAKHCDQITVSVECPKPVPWWLLGVGVAALGGAVWYWRRR